MATDFCIFNFCCGVVEVEAQEGYDGDEFLSIHSFKNRYAFGVSTFTKNQKKQYEDLKKKYKIVAQSPVRLNPKTGNAIFVVVFTKK